MNNYRGKVPTSEATDRYFSLIHESVVDAATIPTFNLAVIHLNPFILQLAFFFSSTPAVLPKHIMKKAVYRANVIGLAKCNTTLPDRIRLEVYNNFTVLSLLYL